MELEILPQALSVCQIDPATQIDASADLWFLAKTDRETSLVCPTQNVPANTLNRQDGWRGFRLCGTLDFSLVGILAKLAALLAGENIPIFALSTFNTDYLLTPAEHFNTALATLKKNGYTLRPE